MGYTVKTFEILDLQQRDIPTHRFFPKKLARQNGGMMSRHDVCTLTIVIVPGSLQNNLTKANAMGERRVLSKNPPRPTFTFTS